MNPDSKVALVTGAGSGIGKHVALALMHAGYTVVLAGRRREPLEAVAQQAKPFSSQTLAVPTDVRDPASVQTLFDQTWKAFGRLDLLFNNAGVSASSSLLEDLSFQEWTTAVDTNLTGPFLCTQQAFKIMKNQTPHGGRIINNGSLSAHSSRPNFVPYTATKHAITGLTRATALDGRKYNIACGQIDIGNAATEMTGTMQTGVLQANGSVAAEPTMDVQHVVRAILYMAGLPLDANVLFMTVMATKMPFVGRG